MEYRLHPLGDNAVIIELGEDINLETQQKVKMITSFLDKTPPEWMIEYIPSFTTVTIFYDPVKISYQHNCDNLPYDFVCSQLQQLLAELKDDKTITPRLVEIPVCYGGEFGPDLEYVAAFNGLTTEEVIHIHSSGDYLVYMIGFAPGFPYIGGMSEKIATPRRETPRLKIPSGSVGIAGKQTGVYPIETPGGWQLIGRTPLKLFRPDEEPPSLLMAGDKIKFVPISYNDYKEMEEDKG
ncbi:5-oxoprolinase subunit PxpB [Bacillus methanolicus]|uniref:Kinase A inhibitor n=1 Tax=Bacillus methanolicus (strain MGA3 / ATCC 53907) TaxID=796606 RepID=I3E334_BACMM|nr:5-oxoprolinase subunit PxpB [Bacillus methanolicus]AIE58998.1 Kinase A inhibitor [Bacillus methanolicus MGA3]EIJ80905.1 Allophanate hydrolase subunit 1 [Bacillus methanolicus MGA3]UQD51088.1 allophanate hydrolase subunit 1 [Bacillus methanolicus]